VKILLAHNYYGSEAPSGENQVFEAEQALLREHGHEVRSFTRHSAEIRRLGSFGTLLGALSTPWNPLSSRRLTRALAESRPNVLHVHNTFPLLSPSIFHAAHRARVPVVLTLHNYRLVCANSILMRKDRPCKDCLDRRSPIPALRHGCYRNSRLATIPMAAMIALHRRLDTWSKVDAFIALTEFQRDLMIRAGLTATTMHVKPQFYPAAPQPRPWDEREPWATFMGRLDGPKGVRHLVEAWLQWGPEAPELHVVGSGPAETGLRARVAGAAGGHRVILHGQVGFDEAQQLLATSRLLIVPSTWYEGFPMVIREAFALGVPVAASRLGAMGSLVEEGRTGTLFAPADSQDLLRAIRAVWMDQTTLRMMGLAARREFEAKYTPERNYEQLMHIYEHAIRNRSRRYSC
jgi:glycosyltransferase involved in cell wall biosynthesis